MGRSDPQPHLETMLLESGSVRDYLDDFALRAGHRLGADTEVSISLRHDGHDRVAATSSERAARCDDVEHTERSGPCVTAMDHLQVVLVPDIMEDTRWGSWRRVALDAGYRSAAGIPAHVAEGAEIALNLYSERVDPWDRDVLLRADVFAQDVARTVRLCLELARLTKSVADAQEALEAQAAIEQAITVTAGPGTTVPEALEGLRDTSVERGADPVDVAREVVQQDADDDGDGVTPAS